MKRPTDGTWSAANTVQFPHPEVPASWTCYRGTILGGGKKLHFDELDRPIHQLMWQAVSKAPALR
jgi:hypothetical protein